MLIVTVQEYRDITRDINTPAEEVSARLEEAHDIVEEYLHRVLRYGTYTEDLEVWGDTYVYPLVTPIVSIPIDSQYAVDVGATRLRGVVDDITGLDWWALYGGVWDDVSGRPAYARVTYNGGYTELTAPRTLKRAIARAARALVTMDTQRVVGATQISVGDVSVKYATFTGDLEALVPGVSLALKPYKRKRVRY